MGTGGKLLSGLVGMFAGVAIAIWVGNHYGIPGLIVLMTIAAVLFVAACFGERDQ